jgi:hypothetical protein
MPIPPETAAWCAMLDDFTERHAGRRTILELDDPLLGLHREQAEYPLRGIAYDRRDHRVEIMLGEQASVAHHITRSISAPDAVRVIRDARGQDRGLAVEHGPACTLLRFV